MGWVWSHNLYKDPMLKYYLQAQATKGWILEIKKDHLNYIVLDQHTKFISIFLYRSQGAMCTELHLSETFAPVRRPIRKY